MLRVDRLETPKLATGRPYLLHRARKTTILADIGPTLAPSHPRIVPTWPNLAQFHPQMMPI